MYKKFLISLIGLCLLIAATEQLQKERKVVYPLETYFFDVGQGDSQLISYLNSYQVLIDGGPSGQKLQEELSKVMPIGDRIIEIVVITHPDNDHIAGLVDVLREYQVKMVLDNGQESESANYQELKRIIEEKGIKRERIIEGSEIAIGDYLKFKAFSPDKQPEEGETNQNSIVLKMDYGDNSFLFMGDADQKVEEDLAYDEENVDADWIKIGHHGSKTATSLDFLKRVSPDQAIISVGKSNSYGHPTPEVLERLLSVGVVPFRTDEAGTIHVACKTPDEICKKID